ncbi:hypothetical protein [Chamaesiphon sp. OTE_75_metabat_556]|uniref:hypothetical protein n=1 Tax=Chamaesiphon sp. OTE_75_metabat_556 TaxID=2964692 RepID=UPI00286C2524|nr:hypothetical protein [Chamaesiphon sp. OTE_75_metabat_556]
MLRANLKWSLVSRSIGWCLALMLALGMNSCDALSERFSKHSIEATDKEAGSSLETQTLTNTEGPLSEVNVPASISQLSPSLAKFQPRVQIVSPKPDEILADDRVTVKFKVTDLPIFKQSELGLGNHLHVMLDRETYRGVYDLNQPLVFKNLAAGTHTLRVFASRPWHESFKNDGAFDQVTFHVLTKTATNNPDLQQPLLTYSRPTGTYGAEPILLDYYLTNAPSHAGEQGSSERVPEWRIRATVNDQQFILDRWAPVYLQGFKPGKNWVRLELLDDRGNPIPNVYNDNLRIVTYDPQAKDALSQLIRGEITPELARTLGDPNYVASKPTTLPTTAPIPTPVAMPLPVTATAPAQTPVQIAPPTTPLPITTPAPTPVAAPSPLLTTTPTPIVVATPAPALTPVVVPSPIPVSTPPPMAIVPAPTPSPIAIVPPTPFGTNPSVTPKSAPPTTMPAPIAPVAIVPSEPPIATTVTKSLPVQPPQPEMTNPRNSTPVQVQIDKPGLAPSVAPSISLPSNPPAPVAAMPLAQVADKLATSSPRDRVEPAPVPTLPPQPQMAAPPTASIERNPSLPSADPGTANPQPTAATPQSQNPESPEWQQRSSKLLSTAKAKIRAFTNTIPAKSQRFGNNVRIWANYAKDYATTKIQAWREQH